MKTNERVDPHVLGLSNFQWLTGDEVFCTCPFHNDHHPSMSVNLAKGVFICYVCGAAGRVQRLALELGGRVTLAPRKQGREVDDGWRALLRSPWAKNSSYLVSRGVTAQQVNRYGILSLPMGVGFPLRSRLGEVIGLLVRRTSNVGQRYITYGKKPEVWPISTALDTVGTRSKPLVLVEGVFGVLNAENCDVTAVAVLGAQVSEACSWVVNKPCATVLFDDDQAGYLGAGRLLRLNPLLRVCVPGAEADELTLNEWPFRLLGKTTTSLLDLADRYGDRREYFKKLPQSGWGWRKPRRGKLPR